jgi:hypothetical protein
MCQSVMPPCFLVEVCLDEGSEEQKIDGWLIVSVPRLLTQALYILISCMYTMSPDNDIKSNILDITLTCIH